MLRFIMAIAAIVWISATASAQRILLDIYPSIGPNVTSPSFPDYQTNAINGVSQSGTATGDPSAPSYYQATPSGSTISILDMLSTTVPSWQGTVNPAPPFNNELGSQVYFGVRISDPNGNGFELANLTYTLTDSNGALSTSGDFSLADYSDQWVGVRYTANGTEYVTSGSGTQRVNELWGLGIATSIPISGSDLAGTVNGYPGFTLSMNYTIYAYDREELQFEGNATLDVAPAQLDPTTVPAPAGAILALSGLASVLLIRPFRRKPVLTNS